ncbi:alpha/beta hydrolase [uncultured Marinobacter sp.]|uniref:alpha/beta fold hydrolase n=1 Tax=uncultured Marinobacter sp. TaxID=187379 RepID=UPI0030D9D260|tara:strand:+ start:1808 stop:2812 length:1005 start_codon:yes stop_codon:yes gene_type:complete
MDTHIQSIESGLPAPDIQILEINGLTMKVASMGSGPLVVLCHGFPELAISWRSQIVALAAAGYRAVAPDMRGYGGTTAPSEVSDYTMLHIVGDMVELVSALGEKQAAIVGHDWGALVAWSCALLRPDLFTSVAGMSVPFVPVASVDILSALRDAGVDHFYLQYFQAPGVAEAELEQDVAASIRRMHYSASGDGPDTVTFGMLKTGKGILDNTVEPETLPAWLSERDVEEYASEFQRTGFSGGLNWYRNIRRSSELMAPWRGQAIHQPSLFIAGEADDVLKFPNAQADIDNFPNALLDMRGCHILPDAGHWIQRERATAVNELLIEFLDGLKNSG